MIVLWVFHTDIINQFFWRPTFKKSTFHWWQSKVRINYRYSFYKRVFSCMFHSFNKYWFFKESLPKPRKKVGYFLHGDNSKWIISLIPLFTIALILKYLIDKNKVVPFLHHVIGSRHRFGLRNTKKVPKIEIISGVSMGVTISLRSKWQKYNKVWRFEDQGFLPWFCDCKKINLYLFTTNCLKASSFFR